MRLHRVLIIAAALLFAKPALAAEPANFVQLKKDIREALVEKGRKPDACKVELGEEVPGSAGEHVISVVCEDVGSVCVAILHPTKTLYRDPECERLPKPDLKS